MEDEYWPIFTFAAETQNIFVRPALAGGETATTRKSSFVASRFAKGEVSLVSTHDSSFGEAG